MYLESAIGKLAAGGIESPRFEAQVLLALALGVTRTQILTGTYLSPTSEQTAEFDRLVEARASRVPLAYLRGNQEFYGLEFVVTPATLIPRPETEMLVEIALRWIGEANQETKIRFADVGTGTGCLPISVLAHASRSVRAIAIDVSLAALAVAKVNAMCHDVYSFLALSKTDLLSGIADRSLDFLLSNPPYIETATLETLQPEVRDYEPRLALDGGEDGLEIYRRLLPEAARVLKPDPIGKFAVEVGMGQAQAVAEIAERAGFDKVQILPDLAGIERVIQGELL